MGWQEVDGKAVAGFDYGDKATMCWISLIRLPDFVTKADFDWAVKEATAKKKTDFSKAEFFTYDEPATIALMKEYAEKNGYTIDITDSRYHHEIYLGDPRKTTPEKLKTVIRYPIKHADR